MITLSERARVGYSRLYQNYNDIDIFVEDSTYVGLYERIFNRILSGRARVSRVTALGPREVVEARARQDAGPHPRPRLYIVDGDLDILAKGRHEKINNLHRLSVYSVENLVIDDDGLKEYCKFACPGVDEEQLSRKCSVDGMNEEIQNLLVPYVIALSIARRLNLGGVHAAINPPSVSYTSGGKRVGASAKKVRSRISNIINELVRIHGRERYRKEKKIVMNVFFKKGLLGRHIVPGKLFALAYLNERIGIAGGMTLPQRAIVSFLAEKSKLNNDKMLLSRIKRISKDL